MRSFTKRVKFGQVPSGIAFQIQGDSRTWYHSQGQAYTYKDDGISKVFMDFIPFDQIVLVQVPA